MSNVYTVITPTYFSEDLKFNEAESNLLINMGFDVSDNYLYANEYVSIMERDEQDDIVPDDEKNGPTWDLFQEILGDADSISYYDVIQSYLNRINSDKYIAFQGAYYSDRASYDSSGGFACFVTKNYVKSFDTNDFIQQCEKIKEGEK